MPWRRSSTSDRLLLDRRRVIGLSELIRHQTRQAVKISQSTRVSTASAESLPNDNDNFGAAILPLITNWSWVHRRVDLLQIIADGQTRRRLSIDLELPYSEALRTERNPQQVVVPLTFIRKGMLINLDLEFDGAAVPSVRMKDNGNLTYQAMRLLAAELSLGEELRKAAASSDVDSHGLFREADQVIKQGIHNVIYDEGLDPAAEFSEEVYPVQQSHRHQLFAALALVASRHRVQAVRREALDTIELSFWLTGAGQRQPGGEVYVARKDSTLVAEMKVFDSSPPVQCLALALAQAIESAIQDPSEGAQNSKLQHLELLCSLLATTSLSYLFCVVVGESHVWGTQGDRVHPRRVLAKLSCDAEQSAFETSSPASHNAPVKLVDTRELASDEYWRVADETTLLRARLKRRVCGQSTSRGRASKSSFWFPYKSGPENWGTPIDLAYSTTSSASTHLEIEPPEGANVIAIHGLVNYDGDSHDVPEAHGYLEPGTPAADYLRVTAASNRSAVDAFPRPTEKRPPHGTSRSSQSRVHIYNRQPQRSVEWLRVWFAPDLERSPQLAALVMCACVALGAFITLRGTEDPGLGSRGDLLAVMLPLLVAVYGLLWFSSGTHEISKLVAAPVTSHVLWSACISIVSIALPTLHHMWVGVSGEHSTSLFKRLTDQSFTTADCVIGGAFLLLLTPLALWILVWACCYGRFCRQSYENRELIIKSVRLNGTLQRECISVMETGAWDVEYLTHRYVWYVAGRRSVKDYLHDLQETASELADKVNR